MTATPVRLKPVRPGQVRNALLNALARHGIEPATADSIWLDLTTGQDPRPHEVPAQLSFRGINVVWPQGRHTRALRPDEIRSLNSALRAAGVNRENMLDPEDTAEVGRHAFGFLWTKYLSDDYNHEPVRAAQMRELVEEATALRHAEPLLIRSVCECGQQVLAPEGAAGPTHLCKPVTHLDNALCWSSSPVGKRCLLDNHHGGKHKNGSTTWMDKPKTTVQHVTPARQRLAPHVSMTSVDPLAKLQADLAAFSVSLTS